MKTTTKIYYLENGKIIEEEKYETVAERDAHEKELDDERNARIARQQEPEAYIPDPTHPDLPLNENRVSDFEYHYGEIAFYAGCLVLIALFLFWMVNSTPM